MTANQTERGGLIRGFLAKLRFPQLFALIAGLFLLDFFLWDPLPLVDEVILAALAVMIGMWKDERAEKPPPIKNVTPSAKKPSIQSEPGSPRPNGT